MPDESTDPLGRMWTPPPGSRDHMEAGRQARRSVPRRTLASLTLGDRDPLGILDAQNLRRVAELVPLRNERMAASPFAFFRGSAAIMAADLAADPHSGILVASSGDAHLSNFGFYASPQRTLVFDLNDFDEAGWAPWEWDVKRLVTSVVIAGQDRGRGDEVIRQSAFATIRAYARAMSAAAQMSPLDRYFSHFDASASSSSLDDESREALRLAIKDAQRRTGVRAARRLTETDAHGRRVFIEQPPTMVHVADDVEEGIHESLAAYLTSANPDVAMLVQKYVVADVARRVVGVGSVGTRCTLTVLQDGDGNTLLLQSKQATRSVLEEYGRMRQPASVRKLVAAHGEGARVVALQRILQAVSDPFLGHLRTGSTDHYVRQFHDMKGGFDVETLDDIPFARYAEACGVALARAHSQSPAIATAAGYIGGGRAIADAVVEWAWAYAEVSRQDFETFVARRRRPTVAGRPGGRERRA